MRIFLSSWRWRLVAWITALAFIVLFVYTIAQLYNAVMGGGV